MGTSARLLSWEVDHSFLNMKVFAVSCLLALVGAAPAPDAEADAQFLAAAPYHSVPAAANCKTEVEVLVTQTCVPTTDNVCTTQTVDTEEIEYEKVCKEVVDTICDAPAVAAPALSYHAIAKREAEAEAEADPQFLAAHPYGHAIAAPRLSFSPQMCRDSLQEILQSHRKYRQNPAPEGTFDEISTPF